jgi:ABC-type glutathione transport system ATPase component
MASDKVLLEVKDLAISYAAAEGWQPVLQGVTLTIHRAEVVGMLGASGAGKTTLALALLGLLPPTARVVRGSIWFAGCNMRSLRESELEKIRGSRISMIFQEPEMTLNPVMRAVDQVAEILAAHHGGSRRRRRQEATRLLTRAGLADGRLAFAYPHQLSGGERRRVALAQALACQPALLIADEPTASRDLTLQIEWLSLLKELRTKLGLAMLIITHDPAILNTLADRVAVLHNGRIVEEAAFEELIRRPSHPYTRSLLRSVPPPPGSDPEPGKRLPLLEYVP